MDTTTLSFAEGASIAHRQCREMGFATCIHYAPNWQPRADALYARLNAADDCPDHVGMLADGRMAAVGRTISVFE